MFKSTVMTLANMLHYRNSLPRPQALKRAWAMVKQGNFNSKAVGVTFGCRQTSLMRLKHYDTHVIAVELVHEPN